MNFLESVLSYCFPSVCGICGKLNEENLCKICREEIERIKTVKIRKISDENLSYHCYIFQYDGIIRKKLIQYKFEGKSYLCETFVKILLEQEKACDFLKSCDIIIPVPIDRKRRQKRGYNQTELISKKVAKQLEMIYKPDTLIKQKKNKPQSILDKKERQKNVKDVYQIKNGDTIRNKRIMIIDDIYTTGSTLKECARCLKQAGAKQVKAITIAKD